MEEITLELTGPVDNLCDYTFNYHWQDGKLDPQAVIPHQRGSSHTYQDIVDVLKNGGDVLIQGDVGVRFACNMGVNIMHFGGTGMPEPAGRVFVEGDAGVEAGMGMVSGTLYKKGRSKSPWATSSK